MTSEKKCSDEEREAFLADLSAADDWLFDQEMDAPTKVFTDKLSSLKKSFAKFFKRLHEKERRPRMIADLLSHLNQSEHFYSKSMDQSERLIFLTCPSCGYYRDTDDFRISHFFPFHFFLLLPLFFLLRFCLLYLQP